jgi:hypothetical protein
VGAAEQQKLFKKGAQRDWRELQKDVEYLDDLISEVRDGLEESREYFSHRDQILADFFTKKHHVPITRDQISIIHLVSQQAAGYENIQQFPFLDRVTRPLIKVLEQEAFFASLLSFAGNWRTNRSFPREP